MTEREKEIAIISAIISDHWAEKIYDNLNTGYISVMESIAEAAEEFYDLNLDTNWEEVLNSDSNIICWDDAIIQFAKEKFNLS